LGRLHLRDGAHIHIFFSSLQVNLEPYERPGTNLTF